MENIYIVKDTEGLVLGTNTSLKGYEIDRFENLEDIYNMYLCLVYTVNFSKDTNVAIIKEPEEVLEDCMSFTEYSIEVTNFISAKDLFLCCLDTLVENLNELSVYPFIKCCLLVDMVDLAVNTAEKYLTRLSQVKVIRKGLYSQFGNRSEILSNYRVFVSNLSILSEYEKSDILKAL